MKPGYHFAPDPARAAALDARMHDRLARSLAHMLARIGDALDIDRPALEGLVASIAAGARVRPLAFSDYYDAASAVFDERYEDAERHLRDLAAHRPCPAGQRFDALTPTASRDHAVYFAKMTADASETGLLPPTAADAGQFFARLRAGLELARTAVPALAGEFEALVREVVCVAPDPSKKMQMDGGSHFQLWGALFLNGAFHPTDVSIVEVIAHESAHSLLFGFCTDEPLVLNDDDELFPSPLRADPRPMDGIYHATFVSARMHWAMTRLAAHEGIDEGRRALALEAARLDRRNFEDGVAVVDAHAWLTPLGAALMNAARGWMAQGETAAAHS